MATYAPPRHLQRGQIEEEDAAILKLGIEYEGVHCLANSEVKILLEQQINNEPNKPLTNVYQKTLQHVKEFSRFHTHDTHREIRNLLDMGDLPEQQRDGDPEHYMHTKLRLEPFEKAQLINLCCEDSEEAKSLIPSLNRPEVDDDELQKILNDLLNIKKFQTI
ncbi:uncharacterized protein VTP21DRAFT_6524 [Calcarisporiella thermophila]|uniref:uncharacterized protein n=1 Tax=Calcarisporiella thermophila TaxID=911321 RepID=UPI003744AE02